MFYGYVSTKKPEALLDEIFIITMPCKTRQEAEEEFKEATRKIPRDIYLDFFWGNQNGIVEANEILKLGIRVELEG